MYGIYDCDLDCMVEGIAFKTKKGACGAMRNKLFKEFWKEYKEGEYSEELARKIYWQFKELESEEIIGKYSYEAVKIAE